MNLDMESSMTDLKELVNFHMNLNSADGQAYRPVQIRLYSSQGRKIWWNYDWNNSCSTISNN